MVPYRSLMGLILTYWRSPKMAPILTYLGLFLRKILGIFQRNCAILCQQDFPYSIGKLSVVLHKGNRLSGAPQRRQSRHVAAKIGSRPPFGAPQPTGFLGSATNKVFSQKAQRWVLEKTKETATWWYRSNSAPLIAIVGGRFQAARGCQISANFRAIRRPRF